MEITEILKTLASSCKNYCMWSLENNVIGVCFNAVMSGDAKMALVVDTANWQLLYCQEVNKMQTLEDIGRCSTW